MNDTAQLELVDLGKATDLTRGAIGPYLDESVDPVLRARPAP
jgi:hypothetical protein